MKAFKNIMSGTALAALIFLFTLPGCNNASQDQQANTAAADSIAAEVTLSPEAQATLYSFPTPFEVTTMLEKAKAGFIFDITNPPANVEKYATEMSKALNLGVYSADLCYAATYNRNDETGKFMECTNRLADGLGIAGVYDQGLVERVKKFGNNKDSLVALLNNLFTRTNDFLAQNNRTRVAVLIACGGFAEAMYLAASLGEVAKDNTKIMAVLAAQKDNHMKLLTILDAYNADADMKPVVEGMASLKPIWGNYNIESGKKIEMQKAAEIADLTESVRIKFIQ